MILKNRKSIICRF